MKFAIVYYSKTGHTREMAEVIARGLAAAGGETRFFSVEEAMDADYIDQCAGVIFGTPTYLANTCWQMKQVPAVSSWPASWAGSSPPPTMPRAVPMWPS